MKKLQAVLAACALAVLGTGLTATAAQAYPQTQPTVHVSNQTVVEGSTFAVRATSPQTCAWTFTFAGTTKTSTGKRTVVRFQAPSVQHRTVYDLDWTCVEVAPSGGGQSVAVHTQTYHNRVPITVVPQGTQAGAQATTGGALPNTGGPDVALLAGGGALVLVGGVAVAASLRRRRTAA
ncbi:MAG TPA: LPXTG cell wall anchor domain-containing protein [Marmoricola sp.]|nr:LPXTG cell wall anchor domain-containing protein [Marmoricola sp.]